VFSVFSCDKRKKQSHTTTRDEIIKVLAMTGVRDIRVDSPALFEVSDGNGKGVLNGTLSH
jgi:hypothetical protein